MKMINITFDEINRNKKYSLELGCGYKKSNPEFIGIDLIQTPDVDIQGDVLEVLSKISDGVINEIRSTHFIEHINDLPLLLKECSRVLKPGGIFIARVPHFSNPYFYSDYTHRTFFGLYTFQYFCLKKYFHRIVPNYNVDFGFEILSMKILFGAERPFYLKYLIGKFLNVIFNLSIIIQEYYETNLSKLFPCSELDIKLKKV